MFSEGNPGWVDSADCLGVRLDSDFSFVPHIDRALSRVRDSCSWRVSITTIQSLGLSLAKLEIIFLCWIFPLIEYGSSLWGFRLKRCFHFSFPLHAAYVQDGFWRSMLSHMSGERNPRPRKVFRKKSKIVSIK